MLVRYHLLVLPIHRRPFSDYYGEHDRTVETLKLGIEREWARRFEELPPHVRLYWKDQWYWPPWYFNDVMGYLKVGSDGESSLAGDLYLKRRHFPATAPERFTRLKAGTGDQDEIVYFASISKRPVEPSDGSTYVAAVGEIVDEARRTVRLQAQGVPRAQVWLPGFDLDCIDLARADRQLRQRFPKPAEPVRVSRDRNGGKQRAEQSPQLEGGDGR